MTDYTDKAGVTRAHRLLTVIIAVLVAGVLGVNVSSALALSPGDLLAKIGEHGSGPGQISRLESLATAPANGHIFVTDGDNKRIDEFTPWGVFVKAFGWDVAPGGVNEQQEITVKATSGHFKLGFEGQESAPLEREASAQEVQSALNQLSSISTGGGAVSVEEGASDSSSSRYVVAFTTGPLKEANVAQLTATNVSLAGPNPSASVSTRADGHGARAGLESCTAESGCQAGNGEGVAAGVGQIRFAEGIAVGPSGDIYVRNTFETNQRVQVFDPAGRFLFMFGGEVDKTTHANICTAASGNECGAGVPGTGPGEFSNGIGIAIDPAGNVLVADSERIQEFEADGTYVRSIPVSGKSVRELGIDPGDGDLFATTIESLTIEPNIHKLDRSSGTELCSFPMARPGSLATDPAGHLYAIESAEFASTETLREFESSCPGTEVSEFPLEEPEVKVRALTANRAGDVLVGRGKPAGTSDWIEIYGPGPVQLEPPPKVSPTIKTQFALSADDDGATLEARIDPQFWADTNYYVEYGTGKCSEGGCSLKEPISPQLLGAGAVHAAVPTGPVELSGLQAATTYHYRFVAQSSGGGPIYGTGDGSLESGGEGTFTTFVIEPSEPGCANAERREEAAAFLASARLLPDCRAYEMVSPVDKEGGDTLALVNLQAISNRLSQATPSGEGLTYSSYRAFPGSEDAPYTSQYLARRGSEGWVSQALAPARSGPGVLARQAFIENDFKAFSADLCQTWLIDDAEPLLATGAVAKFPNLYRRDLEEPGCAGGGYEALNPFTPTGSLPFEFGRQQAPLLQGISADGQVAAFQAPRKMSGEAAADGTYQVYEARKGQAELKLVCVLPNGTALGSDCSVGSGGIQFFFGRSDNVSHAVSEDGSRIYWSAAAYAAGKIYLRIDGNETLEVSNAPGTCKTTLASRFWGASADGSKAIYIPAEGAKKEKLCEYEGGESREVASEVTGVAGQSEDLSYVYYVSKEATGGANAEGNSAVAGQPNLYLLHEGTKTFIATLAAADVRIRGIGNDVGAYSDIAPQPVFHVARATPSGKQLTFISSKPLTGADNADARSGEADQEVLRYDAQSAKIACASCSPAGARPVGRFVEVPGTNFPTQWTAAMIPSADTQLHTPRALSDDGNRLFFTSYTSLLPRDVNDKADVYEWEAAGEGGCAEAKAAFSEANDGCLYLISTGESEEESQLIESTPSGDDVYFTTEQSILRADPGLFDIYDARVGGGFSQPVASKPCKPLEGACQEPRPEPLYQPPSPPSGEGNPPMKKSPKCLKGKHKLTKNGKTTCAKSKKKHHQNKKTKSGKAGRAGK